jgi:hypothetical protein
LWPQARIDVILPSEYLSFFSLQLRIYKAFVLLLEKRLEISELGRKKPFKNKNFRGILLFSRFSQ